MNDDIPVLAPTKSVAQKKSLPDIIEASEVSKKTGGGIPCPFSPLICRLIESWNVHKSSDRLAKAGDGTLCAIGLSMLAAAVLAFYGVI